MVYDNGDTFIMVFGKMVRGKEMEFFFNFFIKDLNIIY